MPLNRLPRVFTARIKCAAFYEEAHLRPGEWSTFRGNQPGLFNDDHLLKKEEGVPKRLYFWDTLSSFILTVYFLMKVFDPIWFSHSVKRSYH
ncbi:hypothetical protein Q73_05075 [Bacillus coahuilensis m2-6]|nr:hypothetical protein Q73_05075 [Bacillus coahuilensis m2-6]